MTLSRVCGRVTIVTRLVNTLRGRCTYQQVIKNSKFIAHANFAATKADALTFIDEVKNIKATHNCFAYKVGDEERAYDDGEVAGTAGRQILSGRS